MSTAGDVARDDLCKNHETSTKQASGCRLPIADPSVTKEGGRSNVHDQSKISH